MNVILQVFLLFGIIYIIYCKSKIYNIRKICSNINFQTH